MNYTNLNIKSDNKVFKYIVEYFDDPVIDAETVNFYYNDFGIFFYNNDVQNILHEKNYWTEISESDTTTNSLLPQTHNISSFNLYFPRFSVDTYEKNVFYVLTINTWINGRAIYLGSFLIDRKNTIAPTTTKKFLNDEYYEYVRVQTVDPFYLIYDDEWKLFRQQYCKEYIYNNGNQKNNSASNINITLTPVKKVDGIWIKLDGYDSSQAALVIDNQNDSNYFSPLLSFDIVDGIPQFDCKLVFNELYEDNLQEYLLETYQIEVDENFTLKYCFVIGDKENPYKYKEHIYSTAQNISTFILDEFIFDSWDDYTDGMSANVFVIVQKSGEDVLVLNSNKIFITQEVFKYLLQQPIRKVNIDELDMQVNNYDVVNIIKNEIVSIERPNDYKANIVKPIFVKVQDADSIRLHYGVNENISINLDAYKNKVNSFILKVGDGNFYEIGRTNSGIVFKVIGTALPEVDGVYYILSDDNELVTTGKYTIVK